MNKKLWLAFKESDQDTWYSFTFDINSDFKYKIKFGYERHDEFSGMEIGLRWAYDELGIIPKGKTGKKILKKYLLEQNRELPNELKDI